MDGTFPNHHPDPTVPKNMEQLVQTVVSNSCDIGLGFDGDGDRLGVVDNKGNIIWADRICYYYPRKFLIYMKIPKSSWTLKAAKFFLMK